VAALTAFLISPRSAKATNCSATSMATFSCASSVDAPRCGVQITFGWPTSGLPAGVGSSTKTSRAAPPRCPESSAASSAPSSTMPPRAALTSSAPFFILPSASAPRMPLVSLVSGVWMVMKSARRRSSSRSHSSTPRRAAASRPMNGSKAMTFIFRPAARSATMRPMLPSPITPIVLPMISVPLNFVFSHLPPFIEPVAWGMWRARESRRQIACSAVVTALPLGAFSTMTPRREAAVTSMLSTPMPARPMILSRLPASITSAVTLLRERTSRPS
jgi:hypothetical protein